VVRLTHDHAGGKVLADRSVVGRDVAKAPKDLEAIVKVERSRSVVHASNRILASRNSGLLGRDLGALGFDGERTHLDSALARNAAEDDDSRFLASKGGNTGESHHIGLDIEGDVGIIARDSIMRNVASDLTVGKLVAHKGINTSFSITVDKLGRRCKRGNGGGTGVIVNRPREARKRSGGSGRSNSILKETVKALAEGGIEVVKKLRAVEDLEDVLLVDRSGRKIGDLNLK